MNSFYERTKILVNHDGLEKIKSSNILVAGIGGVGGYVVEGLVRAGIENITIIDNDTVDITNINRQLIALNSTIGKPKTEIFTTRIHDINPNCKVTALDIFLNNSNIEETITSQSYHFIVDCIDSLNCKVGLVETAWKKGLRVYSSMGAGGKLDPTQIEVADLYKTSICPLARFMRSRLKKRGVGKGITAVFSKETPIPPIPPEITTEAPSSDSSNVTELKTRERSTIGSISYIPAIFGLTIAGEIIKEITTVKNPETS